MEAISLMVSKFYKFIIIILTPLLIVIEFITKLTT